MNFADKLYTLRTGSGYSQEALADKLGVSRQAVSKWELGTTLPETEKIVAISSLFNVSIDSLLIDSVQLDTPNSMERVVLKFMNSAKDMDRIAKELVDIMCDGVIDEQEKIQVENIMKTLDSVTRIIDEVKQKMDLSI